MFVHFKWNTCFGLYQFRQKMAEIDWKMADILPPFLQFLADFSYFLPKQRQPKANVSLDSPNIKAAQANVSVVVQTIVILLGQK